VTAYITQFAGLIYIIISLYGIIMSFLITAIEKSFMSILYSHGITTFNFNILFSTIRFIYICGTCSFILFFIVFVYLSILPTGDKKNRNTKK